VGDILASVTAFAVPVLLVALWVYWFAIIIVLINDGRDPSRTLAWLLVMLLLPIVGLVFYFFLGRNLKKKTQKGDWLPRMLASQEPVMGRIRSTYAHASLEAREWADERDYLHLVDTISASDGAEPLPAYDVTLLVDGAQKFPALIEDLSRAQDTINLQYFIWEKDELTAEITAVLLDRLAAGVEVRMLNDFIGNIRYKKDEIRRLRAAGAQVKYDVTDLGTANYRNHRKIVVLDSQLAYTGGINVGQEYIDGKPRYPAWRDTHVKFRGPAVAELQRLFAARWHESVGENLFDDRFFPQEYEAGARRMLAQTVATGVEDRWESARRAHFIAMGLAHERIWIQTPYFVPTVDIYEAMINASLSGIDVRLMMTGWPDKRIAWYAAESYFRPFIEAGGRVFRYQKGFFHSKTMTIDGSMAAIGTMNLDVRSLELHKELMVWFYDDDFAAAHEQVFLADMGECEEVTVAMLDALSWPQSFRDHAARLASNLL
jgi:cardiolipin synthase